MDIQEKIKLYRQKYYAENKQSLLEKKKNNLGRCECCNKQIRMDNINKHEKTKKHQLNKQIKDLKDLLV